MYTIMDINGVAGVTSTNMSNRACKASRDKLVSAMSTLTTDDLTRKGGPIRFIPPGMDIGGMDSAGAKSCRGCTDKPIVRGESQRNRVTFHA